MDTVNKIYNFLIKFFKNNYSIVITTVIFVILELPFLDTARPILVDEAWYANPSYNFIISHSFTNTNIGFGGNGLIVFSFYLSAYFYLLGASLFSARLSSFILGLISIAIFRKILKIFNVNEFNKLITLSLFIFTNLYLSIFKLARPEALAFNLSLCLLITLYYYITKNYNIKYLLLLIILSFLSINSHPFSLVIVLLPFFVITYFIFKNSQYSKFYHLGLLSAGLVISSFFLILETSINNNISLFEAITVLLQRSSTSHTFFESLIAKFRAIFDYFIFSNRIVTFLPQVIILIIGLFFFRKNIRIFELSLCGFIGLVLALLFIAPNGFIYIFIYIFIFSFLIFSLILEIIDKKFLKRLVLASALIVIFSNILAYIVLTKKTYDSEINTTKEQINLLLPQNELIISKPPFWFISPGKNIKAWEYYNDIKELMNRKYIYAIDCDKFRKEQKVGIVAISDLDSLVGSFDKDTLISKGSNIYGNIYLFRYTNKNK
jgi:hypothetical protein